MAHQQIKSYFDISAVSARFVRQSRQLFNAVGPNSKGP